MGASFFEIDWVVSFFGEIWGSEGFMYRLSEIRSLSPTEDKIVYCGSRQVGGFEPNH